MLLAEGAASVFGALRAAAQCRPATPKEPISSLQPEIGLTRPAVEAEGRMKIFGSLVVSEHELGSALDGRASMTVTVCKRLAILTHESQHASSIGVGSGLR